MGLSFDSDLNVVSITNSTNVLLGAFEVFTGEFVPVVGYSSISVTCKSDVGSIFSGIRLQWSSDGVNVDLPPQNFTYDPNAISQETFRVHATVAAPFFRVVYENSSDAQTSFRLVTLLRKGTPAPTVRTIDPTNTFATDLDVSTTQSLMSGVGRQNPEQIQIAVFDDVNIAEFPGAQGPYVFVSPRPGHATNTVRKVSPASLTAAQLTNFENDRRILHSITNRVQRGNLFLQLTTSSGLSTTSYDYVVPPGHKWEPVTFSGFAGNVYGLWDEVYVNDDSTTGSAISVENFYG